MAAKKKKGSLKPRTVHDFKRVIDVGPRGIKTLRENVLIPPKYRSRLVSVLISPEAIRRRVREMAKQLYRAYRDDLYMVITLKGAFVFFSDLLREIYALGGSADFNFVSAKSYIGEVTSGHLKITLDIAADLRGRNVIIVEDIVDTGFTLIHLIHHLKKKGARSVKICSLINKPDRRRLDVQVDYLGFNIPDLFVIGYGMDFDEFGRGFPFIAVMKNID